MIQRVFISGVAGFLGCHLAGRLIRRGIQVVGCDTLKHGGDPDNIPLGMEFHCCDARDHSSVLNILRNVDVVFHAAALGHDGLSVFSPALISENIFSSAASLVSAAAQAGVSRFVYCSSMARYGTGDGLFTEEMNCRPVTPYGIAKVAGELLVKNVAEAHGMEWVVCVPHNIIGPRQRYDDPYRNVAAIMVNRLLQDQSPVVYGDGEQRRCFSSIHDVINVLEACVFSERASGHVVNVGPDEEFISINQLCMTLNRLLKKDISPRYVPARPFEVRDANCCADKARRLFGYKTIHSIEGTLQEMIDWISHKGPTPFNYNLPLEIINERTPATWRNKLI